VVSSTTPYGSLATMNMSSPSPTYSACPLPRKARNTCSGASADAAAMATLPSNSATVRRKASPRSLEVAACIAITAGITLASVVMGPARWSAWFTLMSAWLSTSPLSTATVYGSCAAPVCAAPGCSICSPFTGWQLGSLMMPTLAQRVWPSTDTRASGRVSARRRSWSSCTAARNALTLSPSSPISAAAL